MCTATNNSLILSTLYVWSIVHTISEMLMQQCYEVAIENTLTIYCNYLFHPPVQVLPYHQLMTPKWLTKHATIHGSYTYLQAKPTRLQVQLVSLPMIMNVYLLLQKLLWTQRRLMLEIMIHILE